MNKEEKKLKNIADQKRCDEIGSIDTIYDPLTDREGEFFVEMVEIFKLDHEISQALARASVNVGQHFWFKTKPRDPSKKKYNGRSFDNDLKDIQSYLFMCSDLKLEFGVTMTGANIESGLKLHSKNTYIIAEKVLGGWVRLS